MSSKKWIEVANVIGIVSKAGRYDGTYAKEWEGYIIENIKRLSRRSG